MGARLLYIPALLAIALPACEAPGWVAGVSVAAVDTLALPGPPSAARSELQVSSDNLQVSIPVTLLVRLRDAQGTALNSGGATVAFFAVGHVTGVFDPPTDHMDGTYSVRFTPTLAGDLTLGAAVTGEHLPRTYSTIVQESTLDRRSR